MSDIEKPPHGAPCNGCGKCCEAVLCPLAEKIFAAERPTGEGPCPALLNGEGGRKECGMILAPERFAPFVVMEHGRPLAVSAAAFLIGAGCGCDAIVEGEKPNLRFSREIAQWQRTTEAREAAAVALWIYGMGNIIKPVRPNGSGLPPP